MKFSIKSVFLPLLLTAVAPVAWAVVITPQTGGSIDPSGGGELDFLATGSVDLSAIQSYQDKVIQANWSGIAGTTGNTIDHDAGGADDGVDVRIEHVTTFSAFTDTSATYNSAGVGTGYRWTGTNGQQLEIAFGTQTTGFSSNRTVSAAGLMLMNFGSAYTDVTIEYLDASDNVLSSQNFSGAGDLQTSGGADFFTGYISDSANIAYMTIDLTRNTGSSQIALDALTFSTFVTPVPEPSSVALLALAVLGLTLVRRRR